MESRVVFMFVSQLDAIHHMDYMGNPCLYNQFPSIKKLVLALKTRLPKRFP